MEAVNCLIILKDLAIEGKNVNHAEVKLWLEKYYQALLNYQEQQ